jgi:hypothetical protein
VEFNYLRAVQSATAKRSKTADLRERLRDAHDLKMMQHAQEKKAEYEDSLANATALYEELRSR